MAATRPGDWVCPLCGNLNYANRTVCNRCSVGTQASVRQAAAGGGVPVPSRAPGTPAGYGKAGAASALPQQRGSPYLGQTKATGPAVAAPAGSMKPGDWCCPACLNHNFADKIVCNRCSTPKNMMMHGQVVLPGKGMAGMAPMMMLAPGGQGMMMAAGPADQGPVRPGDWTCHGCKNNNYANREVCNRCGIPKTTFISKTGLRAGDWICPQCQNHNWADKASCFKCQAPKTRESVQATEKKTGPAGDWVCHACKNNNYANREACNRCGIARSTFISKTGLRPGDWLCPQCQNHNWADKGNCGKCKAPRSLDSVSTKGMKPGDWLCTFCSNHNFADKVRCNKCQRSKQVSAVTLSA